MSAATLDDLERMLRALNDQPTAGTFRYRSNSKDAAAWLTGDASADSPRVGEEVFVPLPVGGSTHAQRVAALGEVLRGKVERRARQMSEALATPGAAAEHDGRQRVRDDQIVRADVARFAARAGIEPAEMILACSAEAWRSIAERLRAAFRMPAYGMDEDAAKAMIAADAADAMARGDVAAAVAALAGPSDVAAWRLSVGARP